MQRTMRDVQAGEAARDAAGAVWATAGDAAGDRTSCSCACTCASLLDCWLRHLLPHMFLHLWSAGIGISHQISFTEELQKDVGTEEVQKMLFLCACATLHRCLRGDISRWLSGTSSRNLRDAAFRFSSVSAIAVTLRLVLVFEFTSPRNHLRLQKLFHQIFPLCGLGESSGGRWRHGGKTT